MKQQIDSKIKQLKSPKHKGRYTDKAGKMQIGLDKINEASSLDDVSNLVNKNMNINFKNNKMMGGKVTRGRKQNKKKRTIRRR